MLSNREHVIALEPLGKVLLGTTLRYSYELRDEDDYFDDVPSARVSKDMVDLAEHLLDTKASKFNPDKFKDKYETALKALVKRKASGKTIEAPEAREEESNVIDLMDALKQSLGHKSRRRRQGGRSDRRPTVGSARRHDQALRLARRHGGSFGQRHTGRPGMTIRAQMGWLSVHPYARCRRSRDALQERRGPEAVLSGNRRLQLFPEGEELLLDGEIVVPVEGDFSFDDLLQRIHPAASRVRKLAAKTPALYLAFDPLEEKKKEVAASPC